jgi:hypothetical protein
MVTAQFFSPFRSGTGITLSHPVERRSRCRNNRLFASLLSIGARFGSSGSLYRTGRHRNSRRRQRGIAEDVASKSGVKRITKNRFG